MLKLKQIFVLCLLAIGLGLSSCSSISGGGLKSYADVQDGYEFLYPNGWVSVETTAGPDVVFRDLIETSENVSVVINPVPEGKTLVELGSPSEVGYRLSKAAIAPPGSNRQAELVNAEAYERGPQTYYLLEYAVTLPNQKRHNLTSMAVSRGKLYSFSASTTEARWQQMAETFDQVAHSFSVY